MKKKKVENDVLEYLLNDDSFHGEAADKQKITPQNLVEAPAFRADHDTLLNNNVSKLIGNFE